MLLLSRFLKTSGPLFPPSPHPNQCCKPWKGGREKFENGVFALKTHQMFSVHPTPEKLENATITGCRNTWVHPLWFNHMNIVTSSFSKSSVFQSVSPPHYNAKPVFSNSIFFSIKITPVWSAFSKISVFGGQFLRISVNDSTNRRNKATFSNWFLRRSVDRT